MLPILALLAALPAQSPDYRFAPPAEWVDPVPVPGLYDLPDEEVSGAYYLLVDRQTRLAENSERYRHNAWKILDSSALDNFSSFSIEFQPGYQELVLHTATIFRDGREIDQLGRGNISLLQREDELEAKILTGAWTLDFQFDDTRVGDVVSYSYSLRGQNPALGNHFAGIQSLSWFVPVAKRQVRLVWPKDHPLQTQLINHAEEPSERSSGDWIDLRWTDNDVRAKKQEEAVPGWQFERGYVDYSDFASWDDVVNWGLPLYALDSESAPSIVKKAAEIRTEHPGEPSRQVVAALNFVQEEIRYLGVEIDSQSLVPSAPNETLSRRWGDCKDKSMLLIALLKELNISASPVLADTVMGGAVQQRLPSPLVFNHMITRVELHGETYLLDPTLSAQGGNLQSIAQPNYGFVLPVIDGPAEFVDTRLTHAAGEIHVEERFRPLANYDAEYTVKTTFRGRQADRVRGNLRNRTRDDLQESYLDFAASYYANPQTLAPIEVEDNPATNVLVVTEQYRISPLWSEDTTEAGKMEAAFYPWEVNNYLTLLDRTERLHPLSLSHPVRSRQTIRVELTGAWELEDEYEEVRDEQFTFSRDVTFDGLLLTMDFAFTSHADHVAPDRLAEYSENARAADDLMYYGLYQWNQDATYEEEGLAEVIVSSWSTRELTRMAVVIIVIGLFPLALWLIGRHHRGDSRWIGMATAPGATFEKAQDAIGSLLLLAAVTGMLSALMNLVQSDSHTTFGPVGIVGMVVVSGSIAGVVQLYLASGIWPLGMKIIGGKGDYTATLHGLGWANIVFAPFLIIVATAAAITWPLFFVESAEGSDTWLEASLWLAFLLQIILFSVWWIINAVIGVAAAHQSGWVRSILGGFIGGLIVFGAIAAVTAGFLSLVE